MTSSLETPINAEGNNLNPHTLPWFVVLFLVTSRNGPTPTPSVVFSWRWYLRCGLQPLLCGLQSYYFPGSVPCIQEVDMLLNFCFFPVNLSFTTGMPQPGTQKGSGKMIFPPLQSNRLFHTAQVCGRPCHLSVSALGDVPTRKSPNKAFVRMYPC